MRYSRYINIDSNTLLEYIYDDSNLIGEPYNILYNAQTGFKCFVSTDELVPPIKGYKQTNNDAYNQLYPIGQSVYSRLPSIGSNKISGDYPSLQLKNFATSIPIRYDKIRIHIPINYTFGEMKGFYLRVYAFDFNNDKIIELTNYHFNITDVEQNYKLEYSSPILYVNENQWGKYLEVQIPSVTKVSDQRINDVTRNNSINYNLTDGLGLSKTSPIFIEFRNIESINKVNNTNFYQLSAQKTVVVPQTPEFEKLGIRIEESKQGDFFLIYGTYNGSLAEFQTFVNESFYQGLRYRVRYIVDIIEETIKTKTYTFSVTEDINEEIEFRPILKYTTTTAIIDVTLRLINIIDDTFIERKASFGLLQGGGQRMGAQPNGKLTTGNNSGGGGDISKYASSLTKINLRKSKTPEVINYKSVTQAAVGSDAFGTKAILTLEKIPFVLFSKYHNVIDDISSHQVSNVVYVGNNQLKINIDPFDNLFKFKIYKFVNDEYINWNLLDLTDVKLTIKGDKKDLDFNVYRDSAENDFENGVIVFKIPEGSYRDVKRLSSKGYNLFYINGIDVFSNRQIVYSGFFNPYDSKSNIESLESEFQNNLSVSPIVFQTNPSSDEQNSVNDALNNNTNNSSSVNTSTSTSTDNVNSENIFLTFKPRYRAADLSIATGLSAQSIPILPRTFPGYNVLNKLSQRTAKPWKNPTQTETLDDLLTDSGIIISSSSPKGDNAYTTLDISAKFGNFKTFESYVRGYFKGLNILPTSGVLTVWKNTKIYFDDLKKYVDNKTFLYTNVIAGEFLPTSSIDKKYFDQSKVPSFYQQAIAPPPNIGISGGVGSQVTSKSPSGVVRGSGSSTNAFSVSSTDAFSSGSSTDAFSSGSSTDSFNSNISPDEIYNLNNPIYTDFKATLKTKTSGSSPTTYSGIDMANVVDKGIKITTELSTPNKYIISENLYSSNVDLVLSAKVHINNQSGDTDTVYASFYYASSNSASIGQSNQFGPEPFVTVSSGSSGIISLDYVVKKGDPQFTVGKFIYIAIKSDLNKESFYTTDSIFRITTQPVYLFGRGRRSGNLTGTVKQVRYLNSNSSENVFIVGAQITASSIDRLWPDKIVQSGSDGTFDLGERERIPGGIKLRILKTGFVTQELEIDTTEEAQEIIKDGVIEIILVKNA